MRQAVPSNVQKTIVRAIGKFVPLKSYAVFLFGSRARGDQHWYSDIDVGLWGPKPVDFAALVKIEGELEELPYEIELVDFSLKSKDFKKLALEKVALWNKPKIDYISQQNSLRKH